MNSTWYDRERKIIQLILDGARISHRFFAPYLGGTTYLGESNRILADYFSQSCASRLKINALIPEGTNRNPVSTKRTLWAPPDWTTASVEVRIAPQSPDFLERFGFIIVDNSQVIVIDENERDTGGLFQILSDSTQTEGLISFFESSWIAAWPLERRDGSSELLYYDESLFWNDGKRIIAHTDNIKLAWREMWDERILRLANDPSRILGLNPREYEEMIAHLYESMGYHVELTRQTKDGGKDVIVRSNSPFGELLFYIECKRYAPNRPVDVRLVRALYGIVDAERVTSGILITTSSFTRGAVEFQKPLRHRLQLTDFTGLKSMLKKTFPDAR